MKEIKVGDILEGTVVRVYPSYAIMLFDEGKTGLLHISEISNSYIRNFTSFVKVGNIYKVKVVELSEEGASLRVSLKKMSVQEKKESLHRKRIDPSRISFEELAKKLPEWIESENRGKEMNHDNQD